MLLLKSKDRLKLSSRITDYRVIVIVTYNYYFYFKKNIAYFFYFKITPSVFALGKSTSRQS